MVMVTFGGARRSPTSTAAHPIPLPAVSDGARRTTCGTLRASATPPRRRYALHGVLLRHALALADRTHCPHQRLPRTLASRRNRYHCPLPAVLLLTAASLHCPHQRLPRTFASRRNRYHCPPCSSSPPQRRIIFARAAHSARHTRRGRLAELRRRLLSCTSPHNTAKCASAVNHTVGRSSRKIINEEESNRKA